MGVKGLVIGCVVMIATPAHAEREGQVIVANVLSTSDGATSVAAAFFSDSPIWGATVGSDGPCTVYTQGSTSGLSAGTLTITGASDPITLEPPKTGPYLSVMKSPFEDDAPIAVVSSGTDDVPIFGGTVFAPRSFAGFSPPTSLSRSGYTATWVPRSGQEIWIVIDVFGGPNQIRVRCRVPDTGTFTMPASTFALIPPAYDHGSIGVSRVAETVMMAGGTRITLDVMSSIRSGQIRLLAPARETNPNPCGCETTPRLFFVGSLGTGGVSRIGDAPPTQGLSWKVQLGQRLAHGFHLVEEVTQINADNPTTEDDSVGAGIRWTPFEPNAYRVTSVVPLLIPGTYSGLTAFYLTALVGAAERKQADVDTWSPMASGALGWLPVQGRDWMFGFEFREQLTHLDGRSQFGWQVAYVIQLNAW